MHGRFQLVVSLFQSDRSGSGYSNNKIPLYWFGVSLLVSMLYISPLGYFAFYEQTESEGDCLTILGHPQALACILVLGPVTLASILAFVIVSLFLQDGWRLILDISL